MVAASGEEMGIRKVIAHGGDPRDWNNNLALVFLERNLRLGSKVDTVCLFSQNVTRDCFGYNVAHAFGNIFANSNGTNDQFYFTCFHVSSRFK